MKTIGNILKEAREKKRYSVEKIESITKIKKEFIKNIEEENWDKLPTFSVTLGFVKSIGAAIDLDPKNVSAFLKRDYPPKKVYINPKPDITSKFSWSPKLTFAVAVGILFVIILSYTGYQYKRFMSPPLLKIDSPVDNYKTKEKTILVTGKTDLDAKLVINNEPVILDSDGGFVVKLNVSKNTSEINIVATSRSGKQTQINRKITVE